MAPPTDDCQVPSGEAGRVGDSGIDPPAFSDSVFVADVGGVLDVPHQVNANNPVVTACIQATRCVGAVDSEGFLQDADQHVRGGFLADTLVLTVRARIAALEGRGLLGHDGLDVEVVLHRDAPGERTLGRLEGGFNSGWQSYTLDVPVGAVKFPADPCPELPVNELCQRPPDPRPNQISFVFSGLALPSGNSGGMTFTIDWLSLAPKTGTRLASRPVLLVHGWFGVPTTWDETVWADALIADALPFRVIQLPADGPVAANGALITREVQDLAQRFGVEKIAIVAHSKGGVDSREHVRGHDDVEVLIMIATPNEGTPLAYGPARFPLADGVRDMTPEAMKAYNNFNLPNLNTVHVTASGAYDSFLASVILAFMRPDDELIPVASVQALGYAAQFPYFTSVNDLESVGICTVKGPMLNHSCLLYKHAILDDIRPVYLTRQPPPVPVPAPAPDGGELVAPVLAAAGDPEPVLQLISSGPGTVAAGVTGTHAVVVDPLDAVTFVIAGDPASLDVALISPGGSRIDAATSDPAITRIVVDDQGPMSYAGFDVRSPETGTWTVQVTARPAGPAEAAEPVPYSVTAMAPVVPGVGVALEARVERTLVAAGQQAAILATLTQDSAPLTGVTVSAVITFPDGTATTEVAMPEDGGVYTAAFGDTAVAGIYEILVSAARAEPAFTRVQPLRMIVTRTGSTFSGTMADRGVDTDGDGQFDQLVIDVGLNVDLAATYRLYATLTEAASPAVIEQVRLDVPLEPGPQSVALAFDGARLFDGQIDGPYLVIGLALEDVDTATVVALGEPYTTGPYLHTQFQRPACLLTGITADHGVNTANQPLKPFEQLVVEVEVDLLGAGHVEAGARLRGSDGTLIDVGAVSADPSAGRSMLEFTFVPSRIFQSGLAGPYTLQELTVSGSTFSLSVPGAVAVTQPYAVEDFGPSPSFTVGGTVTGLTGVGLVLEMESGGHTTRLTAINHDGPFTFKFPKLFGGNDYEVRVRTQPVNPVQVCTVANGSGVIADADVTEVQVTCL